MTYLIVLNFILAAFAQNNTCIFYEGNPGPVFCRCEGHFLYIFPEYEQLVTDIATCEKTCLSNVNCGAFNFWPDKYNFTQTNISTSDLSNGNNIGLCEIGLSIHETVEKSSEQGQAFVCDEAVPTSPPTVAPVELCNYFQEDCRKNGCARINGRCQTTCVDTQTTLFSLNKRSAKVRRVSDRDECEKMCINDEHCVAFNYFLTARLCHFGTPVKSADIRFVDLALVRSGLCDVAPTTSSIAPTTPSISQTTPIPSESPSIAITTTTRDERNSVYPSNTPSHLPTYESNPEPSATPAKIPSTHFRICDFSNTQQAVTCLQNYIQSQVEEFNQLSQQIEDRFKTVQSICSARYDDAFSHLLNITSRTC